MSIETNNCQQTVIFVWPYFQENMKYMEHYLSEAYTKRGIKVKILSSNLLRHAWKSHSSDKRFSCGASQVEPNISLTRIRSVELFGQILPIQLISLFKEARSENHAIFHLSGISSLFNHLVCLFLYMQKREYRIFFSDHSNPATQGKGALRNVFFRIHRYIFKRYSHKVQKIFTPNLASKELLTERYQLDEDFIKIVPLGVDTTTFYPLDYRESSVENSFNIGFAGKANPGKNIEAIFHAVAKLKTQDQYRNLSIKISIVGVSSGKYLNSLEKLSNDLDLDVQLLPLLSSPNKLAQFYNSIDVAVFPGSISITTLEASACGTPIILYESIKGLRNRVSKGKGTLFTSEDELVELLALSANSKPRRKSISAATQEFSWNTIAQIYIDTYSEEYV